MNWCCILGTAERDVDLSQPQDLVGLASQSNIKSFSYNELIFATNNFHPNNKIGRGGFGTVYKGTLKNGRQIAAKVLSAWSKQGDSQFLTEINIISNIKHSNLVELTGYCIEGNNRILVYEYVEKGSLDHALVGTSRDIALDWTMRSAICIGTARGLKFLHEDVVPHIIHRDIKTSNILLDKDLFPKIGDFGLAKLFPDNVTHLSTRVAGTTGYLAPEYIMGGKLTKKADVYSFGVLLLEVVSGKSCSKMSEPDSDKFLLEWTWKLYEEGRLVKLVDPTLKDYPEEEVLKFIKVALFCTQGAANRRPTMTQVLEMLSKRIRLDEKELMRPGLIQDMLKLNYSNQQPKKTSLSGSTVQESSPSVSCSVISPR